MKPKTNAEQSLQEFETVLSKVVIGVAIVLGAGLILHWGAHQSGPEAAQARAAPATPLATASDDRNIRVVYPTPYTSAARNERLSRDSRQQAIPAPVVSLASAAVSSEARASETSGLVTHETLKPADPAMEPGPAVSADTDGRAASPVNINTASADALDYIGGGGRIGRAIARHRPYRSVDDLLRKRVLRKDVYERIKGQLATN